jgi:hypothetical protein
MTYGRLKFSGSIPDSGLCDLVSSSPRKYFFDSLRIPHEVEKGIFNHSPDPLLFSILFQNPAFFSVNALFFSRLRAICCTVFGFGYTIPMLKMMLKCTKTSTNYTLASLCAVHRFIFAKAEWRANFITSIRMRKLRSVKGEYHKKLRNI